MVRSSSSFPVTLGFLMDSITLQVLSQASLARATKADLLLLAFCIYYYISDNMGTWGGSNSPELLVKSIKLIQQLPQEKGLVQILPHLLRCLKLSRRR